MDDLSKMSSVNLAHEHYTRIRDRDAKWMHMENADAEQALVEESLAELAHRDKEREELRAENERLRKKLAEISFAYWDNRDRVYMRIIADEALEGAK